MKVSLQNLKRREGSIFVDLDPRTETPTEHVWLEVIGDIAGILAISVVGLLALVLL